MSATVICVDRCIIDPTLIVTNKGLIPIESLAPPVYTGSQEVTINLEVATREGKAVSDKLYLSEKKKTRHLATYKGYSLIMPINNSILCYSSYDASLLWKKTEEIFVGDYAVLKRKTECFGDDCSFEDYEPKDPYSPDEKMISIPKKMTPDLARWLGYLISEGRTHQKVDRISFTNFDKELMDDFKKITKEIFDIDTFIEKKGTIAILSSTLVSFMKDVLGVKRTRARECEIPICILMSSKNSQKEFLRGYFSGDGGLMNKKMGILSATSASENLLKVVQIMLINFGIVSKIKLGKSAALNGKKIYRAYCRMTIGGQDAMRFLKAIGFSSKSKENAIWKSVENGHSLEWSARWDNIPGFSIVARDVFKDKFFELRKTFPRLAAASHATVKGRIATDIVSKILEKVPMFKSMGDIQEIINAGFFIDEIIKIEDLEQYTYSIRVPISHSFICNGLICRKTDCLQEA